MARAGAGARQQEQSVRGCGRSLLGACYVAVAVLGAGPAAELHATILTFDQTREAGNVIPTISGRAVPQDYGDRVTGSPMTVSGGQFTYGEDGEGFTPNVVVEYFTGTATPNNPGVSLWADLYGDLVNVIFGNQNSSTLNLLLTADPGFSVELYHFDLGGWPSADYTISAVRVLDGDITLFAQSDVLVEGSLGGARHTSFDFAAPLIAAQLLIEIDYGNLPGNQQDNIGIDNVRFGQTPPPGAAGPSPVPAPTSALLLGVGLAGLLLARGWWNDRGSRRLALSLSAPTGRPRPTARASAPSPPARVSPAGPGAGHWVGPSAAARSQAGRAPR